MSEFSNPTSQRIRRGDLADRDKFRRALQESHQELSAPKSQRIKKEALSGRGMMMKTLDGHRKSMQPDSPMTPESPSGIRGSLDFDLALGGTYDWYNVPNFQETEFHYSTSAWLNSLSFDQMRREAGRLGRAHFGLIDDDYEDEKPGKGRYRSSSDALRRSKFMKRVTIVVHQLLDGKLGINLRTNISAEQIGSPGSPWSPSSLSCTFPSCDDEAPAGVVVIGFSTPAAREFGWQLFDEVVAVNGEPVSDRDAFAQAYAKARESLPIHFAVLRRFGPEMRALDAETNLELSQAKMQRMLSHEDDLSVEPDPDRILDPFFVDELEFEGLDPLDKPNWNKPHFDKADFKHRKSQLETTAEMTHELLEQNIALTEELIMCRGHLADFEYWLLRRQRKRNRRESELPLPGDEFWPWDAEDENPSKESKAEMTMQEVLFEARKMFSILDGDGSGTVDKIELIKGLINSSFIRAFFGLPEEIHEDDVHVLKRISSIFKSIDKDNNKSLTWTEVKRWIMEHPENLHNIAKASSKRLAACATRDREEYIRLSSQQETPAEEMRNPGIQDSPIDVQGGWRSDHMIAVPAQVQADEAQSQIGAREAQRAIAEDRINELFEALDSDNKGKFTFQESAKLAEFMQYAATDSELEREFEDLCKMHGRDASVGLDLSAFRSIISDRNCSFYCDDEALDEIISRVNRTDRVLNLFKLCNVSESGRMSQAELFIFAQELGWTKPMGAFSNEYQTICQELGADPATGIDEDTFSMLVDDASSDFFCDDDVLSNIFSKLEQKRLGYLEMETIVEDEAVEFGKPNVEKSGQARKGNSHEIMTDDFHDLFTPPQEQRDTAEPLEQQSPDTQRRRSARTSYAEASADKAYKRMSRLQANAMALKAGETSPRISSMGRGLLGSSLEIPELSSPRPEQPTLSSPATSAPRSAYSPVSIGRRSPELDPGRRSPEMAFTGGGQRPGTIREGAHEEDPEDQSDHEELFLQGLESPSSQRTRPEAQGSAHMQSTHSAPQSQKRIPSERMGASKTSAPRSRALDILGPTKSAASLKVARSADAMGPSQSAGSLKVPRSQGAGAMGASQSAGSQAPRLQGAYDMRPTQSARPQVQRSQAADAMGPTSSASSRAPAMAPSQAAISKKAEEALAKLGMSDGMQRMASSATRAAPKPASESKQQAPATTESAGRMGKTTSASFGKTLSSKGMGSAPIEPKIRSPDKMAAAQSEMKKNKSERITAAAVAREATFQAVPSIRMAEMPAPTQGSAPAALAAENPKPHRGDPSKMRTKKDAGSSQAQHQQQMQMQHRQGPPLQVEPLPRIAEGAKDLGVFTFDGPGQDQQSISPQAALRQPLGEEQNPDLGDLIR